MTAILELEVPATTAVEQALHFARIGLHVFPCLDKKPAIPKSEGGQGFHDATTDPNQIREWWSRWPGASIGLACGMSGLFVVDLDVDERKHGVDTWKAMQQEHDDDGCQLATRTPRGGEHRIFRHPGRAVKTAGGILLDVDVRGDGGYVILPSVADPKREWSGESLDDIESREELDELLVDAPGWVLDIVCKSEPRAVQVGDGCEVVLDRWERDRLRRALSFIDADPYDGWRDVGMAIKLADPSQAGFDLWCEWAKSSTKFDENESARHWRSYRRPGEHEAPVTLATIYSRAMGAGWDGSHYTDELISDGEAILAQWAESEAKKREAIEAIGAVFVFGDEASCEAAISAGAVAHVADEGADFSFARQQDLIVWPANNERARIRAEAMARIARSEGRARSATVHTPWKFESGHDVPVSWTFGAEARRLREIAPDSSAVRDLLRAAVAASKGSDDDDSGNVRLAPPLPAIVHESESPIVEVARGISSSGYREQPELALAAVVCTLSATIGRLVTGVDGGGAKIRPHLYAVGCAPTGAGKDHARSVCRQGMIDAGFSELLGREWRSGQALFDSLWDRPARVHYADEFGDVLRDALDPNASEHARRTGTVLLRLFTESAIEPRVSAGQRDAEDTSDERYRRPVIEPSLTIFGTTTPGMWDVVSKGVARSGFLGRVLYVSSSTGRPPRNKSRGSVEPHVEAVKALVQRVREHYLGQVGDLTRVLLESATTAPNTVRLEMTDDAAEVYDEVCDLGDAMLDAAGESPIADLWNRYAQNVGRVALIHAASLCRDRIEAGDVRWAMAFVRWCVERMVDDIVHYSRDFAGDSPLSKLVKWLSDRGEVSTREIVRKAPRSLGLRSSGGADRARELCQAGVAAGLVVSCCGDDSWRAA